MAGSLGSGMRAVSIIGQMLVLARGGKQERSVWVLHWLS
jgi:hypothetical protein